MANVKKMDGLSRALAENDWVPSKTTDKTMAIMSGMSDVPWEKVRLFALRWEVVGGEIVPIVNIMMHGQGDDPNDTKIDVDFPGAKEEIPDV